MSNIANDNDKIALNIPIYEILLVIGIIMAIIGMIMCMGIKYIDILGGIYFDIHLGMIIAPIGIGLICGYITRKILPSKRNSYVIGFLLGIIGIIIAICIRPTNNANNTNSSNRYADLQKLAELKENGIITEEEFNAEKEKILK